MAIGWLHNDTASSFSDLGFARPQGSFFYLNIPNEQAGCPRPGRGAPLLRGELPAFLGAPPVSPAYSQLPPVAYITPAWRTTAHVSSLPRLCWHKLLLCSTTLPGQQLHAEWQSSPTHGSPVSQRRWGLSNNPRTFCSLTVFFSFFPSPPQPYL